MSNIGYKPTDDEVFNAWLAKNPETIFCKEQFHRPGAEIFQTVSTPIIEKEILDILIGLKDNGIRPSYELARSIRNLASVALYSPANLLDNNPDIFAFNNGVINLNTGVFSPHSKENLVSLVQSYDYDPKVGCPYFMQIINRFGEDERLLVKEFAGYCLTPLTLHEISLWFYGPPGSGKSSIIDGFQAMLGPYMGYLSPNAFTGDRFGFANVPGRRLMFSTEIPEKGIKDTSTLKSFISGEPINVEEKFKKAYPYNSMSKLMWAMNKLPRMDHLTDGIGRRTLVVEVPPLDETLRDPYFREHLKNEGPGIFNWAYEGWCSLKDRGKFLIPETVKPANFYNGSQGAFPLEPAEIIKSFIVSQCVVNNELKSQAGPLGEAIKAYCVTKGFKPLNPTQISGELQRLKYWKVKCNGKHYYMGISFKQKN